MGERKYQAGVHGDPFTFMVDEVRPTGELIEHLGGANNVIAASAAYNSYVQQRRNRVIMLRTRARIICRSDQA